MTRYSANPLGEDNDADATIRAETAKRQLAELALEDSEALYHSLVEHLPISVYRIDLQSRLTFGNSAYQKDLGRPLEELLGKTVHDLFPEEEARKYDADDRRVMETGEVFHGIEEHDVRGETFFVEVLKSLVHDHLGRPVGVQGLYWDVTERKRTEQQLAKTLAELERSNAELQQFAGVASHDMHAPLRQIITLSRMIQEQYAKQLDQPGRELLTLIESSAAHMQELINDLLAHSRVGAARQVLELVESAAAVRKAQANLAVPIRESGAELRIGPLPTVMANPVELVQLFQNLISNAVKYRGEAAPCVEVSAQRRGKEWLFRVRDNGIGIPPEHQETIFDAFKRLHGDEKYPGTGIGLATCKKIVERLDGRIWVVSQPGEGSEFFFTIPYRRLDNSNEHPG